MFPKYREDFIAYLYKVDRLNDAAMELIVLVNDDKVVSEHGKTSHQVYFLLLEILQKCFIFSVFFYVFICHIVHIKAVD